MFLLFESLCFEIFSDIEAVDRTSFLGPLSLISRYLMPSCSSNIFQMPLTPHIPFPHAPCKHYPRTLLKASVTHEKKRDLSPPSHHLPFLTSYSSHPQTRKHRLRVSPSACVKLVTSDLNRPQPTSHCCKTPQGWGKVSLFPLNL